MPLLADLDRAWSIVRKFAVHTPILESALLNQQLGFRLIVKPECLQTTGSFKLRGAYHFLANLTPSERARGIVAFSSGNHAQAVAYVAKHFGISARIIMPSTAPKIKRENTTKYGAKVILYDINTQNREQLAAEILQDSHEILLKPFDDIEVLLGQGTAVAEALADCNDANCLPNRIYVPCSGGGLLAGSALAASRYCIPITACEPKGYASAGSALQAGRITAAYTQLPAESRLCDALLSPVVGEHCFPLIAQHVDTSETVQDCEVLEAMQQAFNIFKLVVEPGGAAGLAVAMRQKSFTPKDCVLVVLSGGNVDSSTFQRALT